MPSSIMVVALIPSNTCKAACNKGAGVRILPEVFEFRVARGANTSRGVRTAANSFSLSVLLSAPAPPQDAQARAHAWRADTPGYGLSTTASTNSKCIMGLCPPPLALCLLPRRLALCAINVPLPLLALALNLALPGRALHLRFLLTPSRSIHTPTPRKLVRPPSIQPLPALMVDRIGPPRALAAFNPNAQRVYSPSYHRLYTLGAHSPGPNATGPSRPTTSGASNGPSYTDPRRVRPYPESAGSRGRGGGKGRGA
ncbi:hypothetical protein C8R44DRAFT_871820 [Mycena epipterygia]|nr:hypothetical protein C8R44DRAFT_871820 [Mycena epipterygia]